MKLTDILLRWGKPLPNGHLWSGKHRLYKKVTPQILDQKRREFELEERNMFYLRHPYLTVEQSRNHTKPFKHRQRFIEAKNEIRRNNWKQHSLLGDRFGFLKVADRWE